MPRLTEAEAVEKLIGWTVRFDYCPPRYERPQCQWDAESREPCIKCWRAWAYGETEEATGSHEAD